jgi:hypothetical protein
MKARLRRFGSNVYRFTMTRRLRVACLMAFIEVGTRRSLEGSAVQREAQSTDLAPSMLQGHPSCSLLHSSSQVLKHVCVIMRSSETVLPLVRTITKITGRSGRVLQRAYPESIRHCGLVLPLKYGCN